MEPAVTSAHLDSSSGLLHVSTSVAYLRKRLADIGRFDLLEGAEAGLFSFHAAAIDAGLIKQPAVTGNGSQNASRRTAWALWKATRQSPALNGSKAPPSNMPDLAAALAEWEEAQRAERESAPTAVPPEPERPKPSIEDFVKSLIG